MGLWFGSELETRTARLRLGIRYRLLGPLGLLLVGVVAASLWSAHVAARRAEERVAAQVHNVAQTLQEAKFPLNPNILFQMRSLSGAEFLYAPRDGLAFMTFPAGDVNCRRRRRSRRPARPGSARWRGQTVRRTAAAGVVLPRLVAERRRGGVRLLPRVAVERGHRGRPAAVVARAVVRAGRGRADVRDRPAARRPNPGPGTADPADRRR